MARTFRAHGNRDGYRGTWFDGIGPTEWRRKHGTKPERAEHRRLERLAKLEHDTPPARIIRLPYFT